MRADPFGGYVASLPNELLACVTDEYDWLTDFFRDDQRVAEEFRRRSKCCRDESRRRSPRGVTVLKTLVMLRP